MDEKQIAIFDEIFGALDGALGDEEANGLQVIGAVLALPDEQFEFIKPTLFEGIQKIYNEPDAKIALA